MSDKIVLVVCVQREGDDQSERFIFAALDPDGSMHRSLPLVESDLRDELEDFELPDRVINDYIQKARTFKTITTTNVWWDGMFGARYS